MEIRIAAGQDIDHLLELNSLFNGQKSTTREWLARSLAENTQETVLIAIVDSQAAGFICGQRMWSMCYGVHYAVITELFVRVEYRRLGIAGAMMHELEEHYRRQGIRHFELFTGGDNLAAQAFYIKQGYARTDEIMFRKRP